MAALCSTTLVLVTAWFVTACAADNAMKIGSLNGRLVRRAPKRGGVGVSDTVVVQSQSQVNGVAPELADQKGDGSLDGTAASQAVLSSGLVEINGAGEVLNPLAEHISSSMPEKAATAFVKLNTNDDTDAKETLAVVRDDAEDGPEEVLAEIDANEKTGEISADGDAEEVQLVPQTIDANGRMANESLEGGLMRSARKSMIKSQRRISVDPLGVAALDLESSTADASCDARPAPLSCCPRATCGSRWKWLVSNKGMSAEAAKRKVKGEDAKCACLGTANCDAMPAPLPCCPRATCGSRWKWLVSNKGQSAEAAKCKVKGEDAKCACLTCTSSRRRRAPPANCDASPAPLPCCPKATCGSRWQWLVSNEGQSAEAAKCKVKGEDAKCACLTCTPSSSRRRRNGGSTGNNRLTVASYNLYWWMAFGREPARGRRILANIRSMNQNSLGLQEVDDPNRVARETGYIAGRFCGAQGILVKASILDMISTGCDNLHATGKWGDRYVTYAHLRHKATGRTYWHFNTHWCVHSDSKNHCDSRKRCVGARNMMRVINHKAGGSPKVITGDFNAGYHECGVKVFTNGGFTNAGWKMVDGVFFSTNDWRKTSGSSGAQAGSDHYPVLAELSF